MTAQEWKAKAEAAAKREAADLQLPSGMTIRARRPDPAQLLMWGHLPLGLAAETSRSEPGPAGTPSGTGPDTEHTLASISFARELLLWCVVTPRLSLTPGADEIHPRDIPLDDALFILRWAMRRQEADALRSFRGRRPGDRPGGDGEAVRSAAVEPGGDPGPGDGAGVRPGPGRGGDRDVTTILLG